MLMPGRVKPPIREGAGTLRGALSALGHFWRQQRYGRFQQPKLVFQTVFWKKLTKSKLGQKKILGSSMSKVFGLFFWATSRLNHKIQKTPWISGVETQFAEFGIWKINPKTWMM